MFASSPCQARETLKPHNIFWIDDIQIFSFYELAKRDLDQILKGDSQGFAPGLFQTRTRTTVTIHIPSHVRNLRSQLLDHNSLFNHTNGAVKPNLSKISWYNSPKTPAPFGTDFQSKEQILHSYWDDLLAAVKVAPEMEDSAFFKKYFFLGLADPPILDPDSSA